MRSLGVPMVKILAFFLFTAFKILELRTGASVLGLTPTNKIRSESSIV